MAWTAPRTWVAAETVTAALLNTHLRDNLLETAVAKVTAQGDIVYATAANALARLAKGTAGQGVRMNSGATAPEWFTPSNVHITKATAQTITTATYTGLTFDTEAYDTDTMFTVGLSTTRIVFTTAGKYLVWGGCNWDSSATGIRLLSIWKGGAVIVSPSQATTATGGYPRQTIAIVVNAAAADYVELYAYHDKGSNENINDRAFGAMRLSA